MKMRIALVLLTTTLLWGQTPVPGWEEFSIGPPQKGRSVFRANGIRADQVPLRVLLSRAFGVPENRIVGPQWLPQDRYQIIATVADPKTLQPMLQQELASRFHLLAHHENRETAVFVLKSGSGPLKAQGGAGSSVTSSQDSTGENSLQLKQATTAAFATSLADFTGRPVIDETHMDGTFDFFLKWKSASISSLQAAVRNQLGLELTEDRRSVDLLIIDHIEKLEFPKQAQ